MVASTSNRPEPRRNAKLRDARLRLVSPAGSGRPMSRQELAEAVNAYLWRSYQQEDRLDEDDVGKLERGSTGYGTMFSFPASRRNYYVAVSNAQLGKYEAVERSVAELDHDNRLSTGETWPVSWALSHSYLALARLDHQGSDGGPDGAAAAVAPVLALPKSQRIRQLGQVLSSLQQRA